MVAPVRKGPLPGPVLAAVPSTATATSTRTEASVKDDILLPPPLPRPPHARQFSSHSQGSLPDSLARNSWAPTDQSHGAVTSESHPSKRPLLSRSRSSGVGNDTRMSTVRVPDEFGARRGRVRASSWDEDAHRRRRLFQRAKVALELLIGEPLPNIMFSNQRLIVVQLPGPSTTPSDIS